MARPQKTGLEYFPLDVDMDQDDKVALIEAQHGLIGFGIVIKLLMKIYKNGYFYEWTEKEQLLFSKKINVDINEVNVIINDCIKWELFHKDMLENNKILTSRGVQKRFLKATDRRQKVEIDRKYLLLSQEDVNEYKNLVIVNINTFQEPVNDDINPQSKVKESKVKKSKEQQAETEICCSSQESLNDIQEVYRAYQNSGYGTINGMTQEILVQMVENFGSEWVVKALREGLKQNKRRLKYVEAILQNWKSEGGMKLGKHPEHIREPDSETDANTKRYGPDTSHIGYKGDGTIPEHGDLL